MAKSSGGAISAASTAPPEHHPTRAASWAQRSTGGTQQWPVLVGTGSPASDAVATRIAAAASRAGE